jgi:hypothetical protein
VDEDLSPPVIKSVGLEIQISDSKIREIWRGGRVVECARLESA